jgi:hypothetical protein
MIIHIAITSDENGCLLFDYSTKRYFIRDDKHSTVQTTKFYGCHSFSSDALS